MTEAQNTALDALRMAIDEAGGPTKVAELIESTPSHLSNVLGGHREMGKDTGKRLRRVINLAPKYWADLLVPLEDE